ncbi:MAG: AlpA family phage regulatory protein [Alphaproteobacteria bacterium]|nr:MAG: AlpA family phage regulatory protein [Alphaproteobacteria bacterium]
MNQLQTTATQQPDEKLLRVKDVLERLPMSRSSWFNGVKDGRYPRGVKLGPKTVCWRASDINALIRSL